MSENLGGIAAGLEDSEGIAAEKIDQMLLDATPFIATLEDAEQELLRQSPAVKC